MSKIIGIDLGTTNSVVSIIENEQPKILTNSEGSYTTPSVVAFTKTDEILVGQVARRQAVSNPENTIYSAKRFIGRLFSEVKDSIKQFPFKVEKKSKGDTCVFKVRGKEISPEKVGSLVLSKLKKDAETYTGQKITEAVITVPAYFNDTQRQATKDAGQIAGLKVKRIINEPTAAALAYGLDKKENSQVAIYDFGGGTFDISILEIADQVVEVKATNGDSQLGGDDFDLAILNWIAEEFKKKEGIDLLQDKMALQRLREAAEKAKIELSSTQETSINLPFIAEGEATEKEKGAKHLDMTLTRAKFNQLTEKLIERSLKPCQIVLDDAKMDIESIDEVILVGGSTRIPAVQEAVKKSFNKEPNQSVNPDQVVAAGAAVQAGVLSNTIKDVLLLDVTPLTLGIETLGGIMTPLIQKNTTIPSKKSEVFSTAEDNQTSVTIHVLQGERKMASDNKALGRFDLTEIPPVPRGVPQIEVSFDIDANGITLVSAKDKKTGKSQKIQIEKTNLTEEEIQQTIKEAEIYEERDKKRQEFTLLKNESDQLCYQVEKLLQEHKDKINEKIKKTAEEQAKTLKDLLQKENIDAENVKSAKEALTKTFQNLGAQIYKTAGAAGGANESPKAETSEPQQQQETSEKEVKPETPDEPIDVNYDKKEE